MHLNKQPPVVAGIAMAMHEDRKIKSSERVFD
jgi:hypothetical protein